MSQGLWGPGAHGRLPSSMPGCRSSYLFLFGLHFLQACVGKSWAEETLYVRLSKACCLDFPKHRKGRFLGDRGASSGGGGVNVLSGGGS